MTKFVLDDFLSEISPEEYEEFFGEDEYEYLEKLDVAKDKLYSIYKECLISEKEAMEKSAEDLVFGNGFLSEVAFSAERLRKNRESIADVIDILYIKEYPFEDFAYMDCGTVAYDDGSLCAYVDEDAEMLTQLGTAIGTVSILQMPGQFDTEGTLFAFKGEATAKDLNKLYSK